MLLNQPSNGFKILGLAPARGGSKRIPRKNIVKVAGKPMLGYVLEAINKSKLVNRLVVSTDDKEIAKIAKQFGAEIPFIRPKEIAQDKTPMLPVLKHCLHWLKENENYWPDYVLMIHPTSIFIKPEQIDKALNLLIEKGVDSVETICEAPTVYHPYNERYIDKQGYTKFLMPKERTQASIESGERPKFYSIGNLFAFKPENLFETNTIQGEKSLSVIIDEISAWDINTPFDLMLAECILVRQSKENL